MERLSNEKVTIYKIDESAQKTEEILKVLQYFLMSKSVQFMLSNVTLYHITHWIKVKWFTELLDHHKIANDTNLMNDISR